MGLSENWLPRNLMVIMISYYPHKKLIVSWGLIITIFADKPRWRFTSSVFLRFPVEGTLDQRDLWVQYGRETTEGAAEGLDEWMKSGVFQKKHLGTPPEVTWVLVENIGYTSKVWNTWKNIIVDHHVPHWKNIFLLGNFQRHPWRQVYTDLVLRRDRQGIRQIAKRIQNEETWKVVYKQIEQVGKNPCCSLFFDEYVCKTHVKPTNEWYEWL